MGAAKQSQIEEMDLQTRLETSIQKLCLLGQTPDEVAAALGVLGMKGYPRDIEDCPLVRWFDNEFPECEIVTVEPATQGGTGRQDLDDLCTVKLYLRADSHDELDFENDDPDAEANLPSQFNLFTCKFDRGEYPDLVDVNYVPGQE